MKLNRTIILSLLSLSLFSCHQANAQTHAENGKIPGTVLFGGYPQKTKSAEPIKWTVLESDGDKVLLLSDSCIDSLPFSKSYGNAAWDKSDIRSWLNGEFLKSAFSDDERNAILSTDLDNGDDLKYGTPAGKNTQDKIFLLSGSDVKKYFSSDGARAAKPTEYAISHGAYTNGRGNCAWWLRSPGMTRTSPAYIASSGEIGNRAHEADETIIGVRPALRVKRNAIKTAGVNASSNAPAIWSKYDKNPDKYKATYSGATETATGVVTYIGRDSHGTPSMEISDKAGGKSYVLGVFGSYDEMASASVGDTVTITGSFHIMSSENMVVLKRCKILQVS